MDKIKQLINEGRLEEALRRLDGYLAEHLEDAEAWYLRGNAYRKKENYQQALNSYLRSMELNPHSSAAEAYRILSKILNYSNRDVYNP